MNRRADTAGSELRGLAQRHRKALVDHAAELQSMAATMRELDAASHEIAQGAGRVAGAAERSLVQVRAGEEATAGMVQRLEAIHDNAASVHGALGALAEKIAAIGSAVEVIDDLSDRVDLLALNAALEGARAGEAGRGLQVIAAEMRRMAENVAARTRGIRELLEQTHEASEAALQASERNRDVAIDAEELGLAATASLGEILTCAEETASAARESGIATLQQQEASEGALRGVVALTETGVSLRGIAAELEERIE